MQILEYLEQLEPEQGEQRRQVEEVLQQREQAVALVQVGGGQGFALWAAAPLVSYFSPPVQ